MKIKFITSKRYPIAYSMHYEYDYFYVKDQKEIDELNEMNESNILPIPTVAFSISKILVRNRDFLNFIKMANEKIPSVDIPSDDIGLSALGPDIYRHDPNTLSSKLWSVLEEQKLGKKELLKQYNIHADLLGHIPFLVKAHALMLPFCRPDIEINFKGEEDDDPWGNIPNVENNTNKILTIKIGRKTSINNIEAFLNRNKNQINEYLSKLDDNPWNISPKSLDIYDLREKGKSFSEVANIIEEKYITGEEDYDGRINENSVKKSYSRTAPIMKALFSKKGT